MIKRIDFFGACGVGKSTIYNKLIYKRVSSKDFLSAEEAYRIAAIKYLSKNRSLKSYFLKPIILNQLIDRRVKISNRITEIHAKEALNYFYNNHKEFLSSCTEGLSKHTNISIQKLVGAKNLNNMLVSYYFLEKYLQSKSTESLKVVCDESLTHKVFEICDWNVNNREIVEKYFKDIPLPQGVIVVEGSQDLIKQRIHQRKINNPNRHLGDLRFDSIGLETRINGALNFVSIGKTTLNTRGVPVLELSALDDLTENINKIERFIGDL